MRRSAITVLGGAVGLCAVTVPTPAWALSFDAQGNARFDTGALYTQSFEAGEVPDAGGDPLVTEVDESALDGSTVLSLESFEGVDLPVPMPTVARALRATAWLRGDGIATLEARDGDGRVHNYAMLFPTGRVTSDGWIEVATHQFSVDPARVTTLDFGIFSPGGAKVDALEIHDDGPPQLEPDCAGVQGSGVCGPTQACIYGVCRNLESRVPMLPDASTRADLVNYLRTRFAALFGPFTNRKLELPNALDELSAMHSATSAAVFWRHFRVAVARLRDWHTRASDFDGFLQSDPHPIAVCFIEGVADASAALKGEPGWMDVLVSHTGKVNTFGLAPGDRLLRVDGQHPVQWARSLITVDQDHWSASNRVTHAEAVSRLPRLISRFAHQIEVLRCDAASKSCSTTPEVITISTLPVSPPGTGAGVSCDNRPLSHLPGTPSNHTTGGFFHGIVIESDPTEAIYGLQWGSLNVGGGGSIGPLLESAVEEWRQKARGVILDHRTGYGGTNLGPPILWNFARPPIELDAFFFRQRSDDVGPQTLAEGKALFDQLALAGNVEVAGGLNPVTDVPVALLTHLDGSASDWLPLGLKGAPKTKLFGPYQTAGAFSTLLSFSYWSGLGYSIAVGDTVHYTGKLLNGHGVEPDVIVVPLQSDLLAGKDTVYDAALAWVRQELKP